MHVLNCYYTLKMIFTLIRISILISNQPRYFYRHISENRFGKPLTLNLKRGVKTLEVHQQRKS